MKLLKNNFFRILLGLGTFFLLTGYSGLFSMNTSEQKKISKKTKSIFTLVYPEEAQKFKGLIKIFNNGFEEENKIFKQNASTEEINVEEATDLITTENFEKLITEATESGRKFILAVATTEKNNNKDKNDFDRHYFYAPTLCRWMFDENFKRKGGSYNKHLMTRKEILDPIYFFCFDELKKKFYYAGDESTLLDKSSQQGKELRFFIFASLQEAQLNNADNIFNFATKCYNNDQLDYAEFGWRLAADKYHHQQSIRKLCKLYRQQGKTDLLIKYYMLEWEKNGYSKVLSEIGRLYHKQKKYDLAEKYYLLSIQKNEDFEPRNNLGSLYSDQKKFDLAEKYLKYALEKQENGTSLYALGLVYKRQNKFELAYQYYKKAIDQYNDRNAMYGLAVLCEEHNKLKSALQYYKLAVEKHNDAQSAYKLGQHYNSLRDKESENWHLAEKYYLIALEQEHPDVVKDLGMFYHDFYDYALDSLYSEARYESAKKYYKIALENEDLKDQYRVVILHNLGLLYEKKGKYSEAITYYKKAAHDFSCASAMYSLGVIYERKDKEELAKQYYKQAINHGYKDAKKALIRLDPCTCFALINCLTCCCNCC